MTAFQTSAQQMVVSAWEQFFYDGDRLRSEVSLFGDALAGHIQPSELSAACIQIHRSHGVNTAHAHLGALLRIRRINLNLQVIKRLELLPVADLPDSLLFWVLYRRLPELYEADSIQRIRLLQRLAMLLYQHRPSLPDLLCQMMRDQRISAQIRSKQSDQARYSMPVHFCFNSGAWCGPL